MYSTLQLPDSVVELILDKETLTNDTEKGEWTKLIQHKLQSNNVTSLPDKGDYLEMETEAEQPVAYY